MFSFRDGMQTLTDAIAQRLAHVELGTEVESVVPGSDGYKVTASGANGVREHRARAVLLATPAYVAAKLIGPFATTAAAALAAISYPPVAVTHSVYRRSAIAHALDGFGMLIPECERRQILGTIFSSTLFENRAPDGLALFTSFVGGTRQPELAQLDELAIGALVQSELAALLGISASPDWARVKRWPRAIPQYTLGHAGRIEQVAAAEREYRGLFFCANYRGGVSIGDCVKSADRVTDQITGFLRGS